MFEDEFGLSYAEPVSFTWAPKGQTPQLKRITKFRREISTISGKIYKRHFEGSIHAEKLLVGSEHLVRHIQGPFILIWDRSPTHRGKAVKAFLEKHPNIHVEYLPAYAPELNPEEYCHGNVKRRIKMLSCIPKLKFVVLWIKALLGYGNGQTSCSVAFSMLVSN